MNRPPSEEWMIGGLRISRSALSFENLGLWIVLAVKNGLEIGGIVDIIVCDKEYYITGRANLIFCAVGLR